MFDDCYHRSIGCSIEYYGGPVVNVGGVTEALALHRPPVVTSPSILAHGSMLWESCTMMVVVVQEASPKADPIRNQHIYVSFQSDYVSLPKF